MEQWWEHHKNKVPKFNNYEEMVEVEDLTGCIPLLLQPLLSFNQQNFVRDRFRSSSEIVAVGKNIKAFAKAIKSNEEEYNE